MKYELRLFIDGYQVYVSNLKETELKPISDAIVEYFQSEKVDCELEMKRYMHPVLLHVKEDISRIENKKIKLDPFGFHKTLEIEVEYISNSNRVCDCFDIWCDGYCGVLYCGCIDVCRGQCYMGDYNH